MYMHIYLAQLPTPQENTDLIDCTCTVDDTTFNDVDLPSGIVQAVKTVSRCMPFLGRCYVDSVHFYWQTIATRGLHYQITPSSPVLQKCVATIDSSKPNDLPQIDASRIFSNPNNNPILSMIIIVDRYRFLVMGYLDFELPPNPNLQDIFSHLSWPGEIVVFSMGRRVRILSRPTAARYVIQKAVSV